MTGAERTALDCRSNGPIGTGDVKPWGRWATLGLGVIALLGGQASALAALAWWYGFHLEQFVNLAQRIRRRRPLLLRSGVDAQLGNVQGLRPAGRLVGAAAHCRSATGGEYGQDSA